MVFSIPCKLKMISKGTLDYLQCFAFKTHDDLPPSCTQKVINFMYLLPMLIIKNS